MTIPSSSIPAARAYLLSQLTANIPLDTVSTRSSLLVCLDGPGPNQPDDIVSVGEVQQNYSPLSSVGSGGQFWLQEDYTVLITIDVFRGGDDAAAAFTRARAIADIAVQFIRSDPSLGGVVDRAMPTNVTHVGQWDEEYKGRHCTIELSVACLKTL